MPDLSASTASQVVSGSFPSGVRQPQPVIASRSAGWAIGSLQAPQVILNIAHRAELEQVFLLDLDTEALVGLDQDFIEPQRVDADVFDQAGLGRDLGRISPGNLDQDLTQAALQLFGVVGSLQREQVPDG